MPSAADTLRLGCSDEDTDAGMGAAAGATDQVISNRGELDTRPRGGFFFGNMGFLFTAVTGITGKNPVRKSWKKSELCYGWPRRPLDEADRHHMLYPVWIVLSKAQNE
jgi:hypothetical protein